MGRGYRWLGLAGVFWLLGLIIENALAGPPTSAGTVSLADYAPLITLVLLAVGIMVIGSGQSPGSAAGLADGYVMAVALLVICWVGAFGAEYHSSAERPEIFLLTLLHPLTDLAVLGALLPTVMVAWRRALMPYLSLLVLTGADSVGVGARMSGGHEGILEELAMIVAACLLGIGPWMDTIAARLAPPRPVFASASQRTRRRSPRAKGRAAALTQERGTSDEGRRRTRAAGGEREGTAADPGARRRVREEFGVWRAPVTSSGAATIVAAVCVVIAALVVIVNGLATAPASGLALIIAGGAAVFVIAIRVLMLVSENGHATRMWREAGRDLRDLAVQTGDVVLLCDMDGIITYASPAATGFSFSAGQLTGRAMTDFVHPEDLADVQAVIRRVVNAANGLAAAPVSAAGDLDATDGDSAGEDAGDEDSADADSGIAGDESGRFSCRVTAADGTWRHLECAVLLYRMPGQSAQLMLTARDVSDQVALRQQVKHLTFHDGLTGLPNRAYVEERTRDALAADQTRARGDMDGAAVVDSAVAAGVPAGADGGDNLDVASTIAVIFLDLDGFTAVNDLVGHGAGDLVLAQAARRLRAVVPVRETVARWGGDEFAVVVEHAASAQEVGELAERLAGAVAGEPFRAADREIGLTAAVGVALADGDPADVLLRNADVAMSKAKDGGGDRVEVYAAHMHADVARRLDLASALQRALADGELTLAYQPVVELATSRVTGAEALVRWQRGEEDVPPQEFLSVAEESGLVVALGEWVLREACTQGARWQGSAWDVGVSVNMSLRQLRSSRCAARVASALAETGLAPEALTIEINEHALVADVDLVSRRLAELRGLGVRLAIDDFGTGYAALAHLRQLSVDIIKIDPSFVGGLGQDSTLTMLTKTIVRVGRDLGIEVVAEGIEQPRQLTELREMGCGYGQGFLVAKPMAVSGVEDLIRKSAAPAA
ncbi:MAG TPA: sensor domain-containing phosphodiesterase [Trebonia sp.]|nr:sensor domain-containing phosphodiesterase [Trebonia sp.]